MFNSFFMAAREEESQLASWLEESLEKVWEESRTLNPIRLLRPMFKRPFLNLTELRRERAQVLLGWAAFCTRMAAWGSSHHGVICWTPFPPNTTGSPPRWQCACKHCATFPSRRSEGKGLRFRLQPPCGPQLRCRWGDRCRFLTWELSRRPSRRQPQRVLKVGAVPPHRARCSWWEEQTLLNHLVTSNILACTETLHYCIAHHSGHHANANMKYLTVIGWVEIRRREPDSFRGSDVRECLPVNLEHCVKS